MPETKFAASPFQQENGEYFISTDVFDFELQFATMTGRPSLPGILQKHPRIDAVRLSVAYSNYVVFWPIVKQGQDRKVSHCVVGNWAIEQELVQV